MKFISMIDEDKYNYSEQLFAKLKDVQKRHLELHQNYDDGEISEEEIIAVDKELAMALEEWRNALVTMQKK